MANTLTPVERLDLHVAADRPTDDLLAWVLSLPEEERGTVVAHMLNTIADTADEAGLDSTAEFMRAMAEYAQS